MLRSLMMRSLTGDESAYRTLLTEVGVLLQDYFRRRLRDGSVVDDLAQETLIALHRRRMTYESDRPFTAWLYAIARYKLIDYLRHRRRHQTLSLDETNEALLAMDETITWNDREDVEKILASIPERQRALLRAVKLEGRSVAEVSVANGLSPFAVKVTIHRAIKTLAGRFAQKEEQ